MKHQSHLIAAACVAALALAPASLSAAEKKESKPAASAAPAASASPAAAAKAARPIPFHGMVAAVDQSAKTFTIAGKKSSRVFKVTDKTAITKGAAAATMKDIMQNEEVSGSYWKAADNSLEAKTVKIGAMASGEKKAKKSKKEEPSSSPAASASPKP